MLILFVRCVCKICDKPILKSNMKLHAEDHCLTLEEYEGFYGPHHQHVKKGTEVYHECLVPGCNKIIFLDLVEVELHIKQEHKTITPASYIKNKMDKRSKPVEKLKRIEDIPRWVTKTPVKSVVSLPYTQSPTFTTTPSPAIKKKPSTSTISCSSLLSPVTPSSKSPSIPSPPLNSSSPVLSVKGTNQFSTISRFSDNKNQKSPKSSSRASISSKLPSTSTVTLSITSSASNPPPVPSPVVTKRVKIAQQTSTNNKVSSPTVKLNDKVPSPIVKLKFGIKLEKTPGVVEKKEDNSATKRKRKEGELERSRNKREKSMSLSSGPSVSAITSASSSSFEELIKSVEKKKEDNSAIKRKADEAELELEGSPKKKEKSMSYEELMKEYDELMSMLS